MTARPYYLSGSRGALSLGGEGGLREGGKRPSSS